MNPKYQNYACANSFIITIYSLINHIRMHSQTKTITAILCQVHSVFKKKTENIRRFDEQLQSYSSQEGIDIIVFPQMSFTGYDFKDYNDAFPSSIKYGQGEEFQYTSLLAKRLNAYVLFGYIQQAEKDGKTVLYNSAAIVNREGKPVFNTRKTHLYFADELWATQGDGFKNFQLVNRKGQTLNCAVGICMDINQKNFTSGLYEFGDFVKQKQCDVILFATNWVDHDAKNEGTSLDMYNFWLERLSPILKPRSQRNVLFLAADRIGQEYSYYDKKNIDFLGSSCAISINPHQIVNRLDKKSEKTLKISYNFK